MLSNQHIIEICARHYRLSPKELFGPSRKKMISQARQLAMKIIRDENGYTYQEIALLFNRAHHTTVMSNLKNIDTLIKSNASLKNRHSSILKELSELETKEAIPPAMWNPDPTDQDSKLVDSINAMHHLKKAEKEIKRTLNTIKNGNIDPSGYGRILSSLLESAKSAGIPAKNLGIKSDNYES